MGCCNSKPNEKKPRPDAKGDKSKADAKSPASGQAGDHAVESAKRAKASGSQRDKRISAILDARQHRFRYEECTVKDGEVHPLYKDGLIYRIVQDGVWYVYNDTLDYEAHVEYRFGPRSKLVPGEHTKIQVGDDGWTTAQAVVYPLQTIKFVSGTIDRYKSSVRAVAVSAAYLHEMAAPSKEVASAELDAVRRLVGSERDEEVVLARCVERSTPYVDVNFTPGPEMLSRPGGDARDMAETGMQRPTQYLPKSMRAETNAIRGAVVPHSIDPGYLGDTWLASAMGILAEDEALVGGMFANTKPKERAVGAYRVALNKNGWWRSVIVDDYLPTVAGTPCVARVADDPRELWVSLLEKAYAKVSGSYAAITGGDALQALQDFTGAPTYRFDKEWEAAALHDEAHTSFAQRLQKSVEAGYPIVLSTPGHTSNSYLGAKRDRNPEAFEAKYASAGLRCGYTYYVERIVTVEDLVLFKIHNPWNVSGSWTGPWSAASAEWDRNSAAKRACDPSDETPGTFWMAWEDVINYFDGGGIVYRTAEAVHYRVKGKFEDVVPSVVLEVTAHTRLSLTLVLSQQDKRGEYDDAAGLRFAPCMMSVAKHNGQRYTVEANTSWDAAAPSAEYNFMVARDCAIVYTFEPSDKPYLIVPRIHRKGVRWCYDRPYVLGVISETALDGKADIRCTHLSADSRVFKNLITFDAPRRPAVQAEHQVYREGQLPTSTVSEMLVGTAPKSPVESVGPAAPSDSSEAAITFEQEDEDDDREAAAEQPQPVAITDATGNHIDESETSGAADAGAASATGEHPTSSDRLAGLRIQDSDNSSDEL